MSRPDVRPCEMCDHMGRWRLLNHRGLRQRLCAPCALHLMRICPSDGATKEAQARRQSRTAVAALAHRASQTLVKGFGQ